MYTIDNKLIKTTVLVVTLFLITFLSLSLTSDTNGKKRSRQASVTGTYDLEAYMQLRKNYLQLSPAKKFDVWKTRLLNINGLAKIDSNQALLTNRIINRMNPHWFSNNSDIEEELTGYAKEVISGFGKLKAGYLFASLTTSLEEYKGFYNIIDAGKTSCNCSTKSDFCIGFATCKKEDCDSSKSGCGFLWMYPCNGVCQY